MTQHADRRITSRDARAAGRAQRGQSMVETLIGLLTLAPLAAGIMLIGQYSHISMQTELAAREAAWAAADDPALARASLPPKAAESQALRTRTFALPGASIKTDSIVPNRFSDPVLYTFAGHGLLEPKHVTLTYSQTHARTLVDESVNLAGGVLNHLGHHFSLPPNANGLLTARVDARTDAVLGANGKVPPFLGSWAGTPIDYSAKTVLLADDWQAAGGGETLNGRSNGGAAGSRTVRRAIEPMVPSLWLPRSLRDMISVVAHVMGRIPLLNEVLTPGFDGYEPGRTAPDVVPTDKLVPYDYRGPGGGGGRHGP